MTYNRLHHDKRLILIIDDNQSDLETLADLLSDEYDTLHADNGLSGLKLLKQWHQSISLVCLDVHMPIMSGIEFLRRKHGSPNLQSIPVIVMTRDTHSNDEIRCLELGAIDYVNKPYNPDLILRRIDSIVRLREASMALRAVEFDEETGVYTKSAFFYYADRMLTQNPQKRYHLLLSDIDDAHLVRERYGDSAIASYSAMMSEFLQPFFDSGMLVGRLTDSMYVSLINIAGNALETALNQEMTAMRKYAEDNGILLSMLGGLHFGVIYDIDHSMPVSMICERANMALQTIRNRYGMLLAEFDDSLLLKAERMKIIEESMQDAIDEHQFHAYYQPKHDVSTGRLIGAEALVRWHHPVYGKLLPMEFIPVFENNGFISELDCCMWRTVCEQLKQWIDEGLSIVPVSINASRKDFERPGFAQYLLSTMKEYEIDPSFLHIEITETIYSSDEDRLVAIINELKENGVRIELDDFGSGYSIMNALTDLPLDVVKLDLSFMRQLHDSRKRSVLEACISLSHKLGLQTVSEGVETGEQVKVLTDFGCDWAQGFYYSGPLSKEEFGDYLKKYSG